MQTLVVSKKATKNISLLQKSRVFYLPTIIRILRSWIDIFSCHRIDNYSCNM